MNFNNVSHKVMCFLILNSVAMLVVSLTELAAACTDDESVTTWNMSRNSLHAFHVNVKTMLSRNSKLHSNH